MFNQVMSGRILMFFAWIGVLFGAYLAFISMSMLGSSRTAEAKGLGTIFNDFSLFYLGLAVVALILTRWVVVAANQGKAWGRLIGIILGALFLSKFPVGTVIGIVVIWGYTLGWGQVAVEPSTQTVTTDATQTPGVDVQPGSEPREREAVVAPNGMYPNSCKQCGKNYFTKHAGAPQGLCRECKGMV